ncbi:MAG: HAMP domain-containing histidine kinase [Oscillospiraceae bacterium]|nr:HAMP domain-containing histidine kinase [Oscillospiraceae bacterium]
MKIFSKPLVKAALLAALYFAILLASAHIITYFPYSHHLDGLRGMAEDMAAEYEASDDLLHGTDLHEMGAIVVDKFNNTIEFQAPNGFKFLHITDNDTIEADMRSWVERDVDAVLSGSGTSRLVFIWEHMVSAIVIGVPLANGGAFFCIRDLQDLNITLLCFAIIYTVLFLSVLVAWGLVIKKLKAINLVQQKYVANVSHSLKSPLALIKGLAETVNSGLVADDETKRHYISIIISESVALEHTVTDMLKLSAIQSHQIDLAKSTAEPEAIFAAVIEKYAALCDDIIVDFRVSGSIKTLPPLCTNAKRMAEVLDILLNNALKFVRDEGCISLDAEQSGKRVCVAVHNDGAAIDAETGRHIFDRFYKGTTPQNAKGSGLGLAIARETTASLGEKLWYENDPEGVTFYFTIEVA